MKYLEILSGCILDGKPVFPGALLDPATVKVADMQILLTARLARLVDLYEVSVPAEEPPKKKRVRK